MILRREPRTLHVVDLSKAEPGAIYEYRPGDAVLFWQPIVREDELYRPWRPRWFS